MREFKVIEEKENPLFNRKELKIEIVADVTPSRLEAGKAIAEKLSVDIDRVSVQRIDGKFGSNSFIVEADVYNSKEDREKVEGKIETPKEDNSNSEDSQASESSVQESSSNEAQQSS